MNLYQIALPQRGNDNGPHYHAELTEWENRALYRAGGYTALGLRTGAWNSDTGHTYTEDMYWYQVACDPDTMNLLVQNAMELFPDQVAFFVAQVGAAQIIERARWMAEPQAAE